MKRLINLNFCLKYFSYLFAEQVLNSKFALKQEINSALLDQSNDIISLSLTHYRR